MPGFGRNTKKKEGPAWVMPTWMEAYREQLADYGLGVEDLMNDHDSTIQNNAYRALVIVGLKAQIGLLGRLNDAKLLRESRLTLCGNCGKYYDANKRDEENNHGVTICKPHSNESGDRKP